jgi:hypothetical protein
MTYPPLPGTPYGIAVSAPADFHRRRSQSRFHLVFAGVTGVGWLFDLRRPVRFAGRMMRRLEAFPRHPNEPLDVERPSNVALCRFVEDNGRVDSDWLIATVAPDLDHEAPVPFWPPWKHLAHSA